jgi:hypothetical protein
MHNYIVSWKSSVNGILAFLITTGTVLLATGNSLFSPHITLYLTIGLALCRAYVGLIQADADKVLSTQTAPSVKASSSAALRSLLLFALLAGSMMFIAGWTSGGCSSASGLHKAAAAADVIGSSLQTAEGINHDAETQGVESIAERDAVASYILQAAQANYAFVSAINSAEQSGTTTVPQSVVSAFNILVAQVNTLNSEGVLQLKSATAQKNFQIVISTLQSEVATIQLLMVKATPAA